jgi:hypothetical protein
MGLQLAPWAACWPGDASQEAVVPGIAIPYLLLYLYPFRDHHMPSILLVCGLVCGPGPHTLAL